MVRDSRWGGAETPQGGGGATHQAGRGKENGVVWEWHCGPRVAAEIREVAVGRFITEEFMAEWASRRSAGRGGGPRRGAESGAGEEERSDEELGGWRARAHWEEAQKRLTALLKGGEHAAGETLLLPLYSLASHKVVQNTVRTVYTFAHHCSHQYRHWSQSRL